MTELTSYFLAAFAVLWGAGGQAAIAGRGTPEPVLVQLEEGYGIVAAEVVKAQAIPAALTGDRAPRSTVTFRLREVLADSTVSGGLGLKIGGAFVVELGVGYDAEVEDWGPQVGEDEENEKRAETPFTPAAKFYLTIRKGEAGKFEHAVGGGAARQVQQYDEAETRLAARLRELATVPKERRTDEELTVAADPSEPQALRIAVTSALSSRLWREQENSVDREKILKAIGRVWDDPRSGMETHLLMSTDFLLRANHRDWEKSDARRRVLLERSFAPFPEDPKAREAAIRERDLVVWFLRDELQRRPEQTAEVAIENMSDKRFPAQFRWRLAEQLQYAYQRADAERPAWAEALQAYYPKAIDEADPSVLRLLATTVEAGAKAEGKRKFVARKETEDALRRAAERIKALGSGPGVDPEAGNAAGDIVRAMKALEAGRP